MAISEILRPNGSGDDNGIIREVGAASPNHYLNVDETIADDATTMVYDDGGVMHYDTYELTDPAYTGVIEKIVLHGRFMVSDIDFLALHKPDFRIRTGGSAFTADVPGDWEANVWDDHEKEYTVNPNTSLTWTKSDLTSLQAGCGLMRPRFTSTRKEYCTQIYVRVHYTSISEGLVPGHIWIEGTGGLGGYVWIEGTDLWNVWIE